jgi:hypothetical protein
LRLVPAGEVIAIENPRAIGVGNDDIVSRLIGDHGEHRGGDRVSGAERHVTRLIAESRGPAVAHQDRRRSEQQEIEIVIVVVVDPDGGVEGARRKGRRGRREHSALVPQQHRSGVRQDREIGKSVVVEIPRCDPAHVRQHVETGALHRRGAIPEQPHAGSRPDERVRTAVAIRIDRERAGGGGIQATGERRIPKRHGRGRIGICGPRPDRIDDFGVAAPVDVFADGGVGLLALEPQEERLLARGVIGATRGAGKIGQLEVRRRESRIERGGALERRRRVRHAAAQAIEVTEIEIRDRLVRHQPHHAFELGGGARIVRRLLEFHAQHEPRVRNGGILALRALELRDPLLLPARAQQCEPVVDPFARRVRRQRERLPELFDGLGMGDGVLVEGLPEIAVLREVVALGLRSSERRAEDDGGGAGPASHRASPSRIVVTRSTGALTRSTRPLGHRIVIARIAVVGPSPK